MQKINTKEKKAREEKQTKNEWKIRKQDKD
jgi:hypothetical protein